MPKVTNPFGLPITVHSGDLSKMRPPKYEDDPLPQLTGDLVLAVIEAFVGQGGVPSARLNFATNPTHQDTIDIGADTYEFLLVATSIAVADDANVAVEIGGSAAATLANLVAAINGTATNPHPNLVLADGSTLAIAIGTETIVAVDGGTEALIAYADAVGGNPKAGAPDILLAEALTDAADIWDVGNVNLNTLGSEKQAGQVATVDLTITAAMITKAGTLLQFPFNVGNFRAQVLTAAGLIKPPAANAYTVSGDTITVTLPGGGGDIVAGDVLQLSVYSTE